MPDAKETTFADCRCPHCGKPFDFVPISSPACPFCNTPIDSRAVWLTRRAPGEIELPGWLRAFGWPLGLILLGLVMIVIQYYWLGVVFVRLPMIMIGFGLVAFCVKILTDGEE